MRRAFVLFIVVGLLSPVASCVVSGPQPAYYERPVEYAQDSIYERIENQQKRINEGIRTGQLTGRETDMLQDNLNWIKNRYERMHADGVLTQHERERMNRMLDKNSHMIRDKKHNPATRLYDADVEERMDRQQQRIDQGIASGELTRREAGIVQDNLDEIRRRYARMRKDRVLTMRELEKLDKMLDENSKMIYRKELNRKYQFRRVY